jgi:hypothetical protein
MEPVIEVSDLCKFYAGVVAVDGVSFNVIGAHPYRSQGLGDARFIIAPRRVTPNRPQVAHCKNVGGSGVDTTAARPSTMPAADAHTATATPLPTRSPTGS